jgi:hypothetical protein
MTGVIFALLKQDQELLAHLAPGTQPPEPTLYDPAIHRQHRLGQYRPTRVGTPMQQRLYLPADEAISKRDSI